MVFHSEKAVEARALQRKELSLPVDRIAVIILGGGVGQRLQPLTKTKCKPAMTFGGRYSLIDVPISHAYAAGLQNIFVVGQYLSYSLQKHLFQTYTGQRLQLLVPEEREGEKIWFQGTADAVRKNIGYLQQSGADYFLILSGDQLYNMDLREMIQTALDVDSSLLIAAQPVAKKEAKRMGIMKLQKGSKIGKFYEKPQDEALLQEFTTDPHVIAELGIAPQEGKHFLGSMGIYFFKREALFDLLLVDSREDFGKHLIQTEMKRGNVHAYLYDGYWEDIGTIDSYYQANLALTTPLTDPKRGLVCYDDRNQLITKSYQLPGACISHTKIYHSIICEGSMIEAEEISHCVLGVRSKVGNATILRDSIVIGNEYYHHPAHSSFHPGIGENCLICNTIIDENVSIGRGVKLTNLQGYKDYEAPEGNLFVREGIIIIPRGAKIPDGYIF